MPGPSREQVSAARDTLVRNGFRVIGMGDLRRHTRGQRIGEDCIVVGDRALVEADCLGRVVAVDRSEDLVRVEPGEDGRPVLVEMPESAKGMSRRDLFARAREVGADVRVPITNAGLAQAIADAEAREPRESEPPYDDGVAA